MFAPLNRFFKHIDTTLLLFALPIVSVGLVTMSTFGVDNHFFSRQLIWIVVSLVVFFLLANFDVRFFKRTDVLVTLFLVFSFLLIGLFILGHVSNGAKSWFSLGGFSLQPSDFMKLIVILILAKYFSRRHVEIAHPKHIFISASYALVPFLLVFFQPDFGSALIIFLIWFGMTLVSGISRKHLLVVFGLGLCAFLVLWVFVFKPYQKERVLNFIHPLSDIRGSGYNAYQSTIAVGSGQVIGKGIGFGTQSRLQFLPEYETDFIFAAFAEEWGFIGSLFLFSLYALLLFRILSSAIHGGGNFEILFAMGVAIFFLSHILINIGMNIGLMPVTGITLPFMSYGGSHLVTEFAALGILSGMKRYRRVAHPDDMKNEFLGI